MGSEAWESMNVDFAVILKSHFKCGSRPTLKTSLAFAQYMRDHWDRFLPEVLPPLLTALPLESKMAPALSADDAEHVQGLKKGYKMLQALASEMFSSESLKHFFSASEPSSNVPEGLERAFNESVCILV